MKTPITIKKLTRSGARREIHNPGDTKEEIMTHSQRPRCLLGFRKSLAPVTSAMIAVLIGSGLVAPVGGEDKVAVRPPYDRRVLSEIARDVLRRGATGGNQSVPEASSPTVVAEAETAGVGTAPDPDSPVTHIAPAQEGIHVAIPPGSAAAEKVIPEAATAGYHSNSWRQRPAAPRAGSASRRVSSPPGRGSTPR